MCQIDPFTLPCCRRVYVEVSRLPSCPNSWPDRKCPPELCIQVRGFEAENKELGTCWRCLADQNGTSGYNREVTRPRIDRASLVLGLEDIGVTGRRRKTEGDGECWFCGARGVCENCGSRDNLGEGGDEKPDFFGFKRPRDAGKVKKTKVMRKRAKFSRDVLQQDFKPPARISQYPDPDLTASSQSQQSYPQANNVMPQANDQATRMLNNEVAHFNQDFSGGPADDSSYSRLLPTAGSPFDDTSEKQQTLTGPWQAISYPQNNAASGFASTANEQFCRGHGGSNHYPTQQPNGQLEFYGSQSLQAQQYHPNEYAGYDIQNTMPHAQVPLSQQHEQQRSPRPTNEAAGLSRPSHMNINSSRYLNPPRYHATGYAEFPDIGPTFQASQAQPSPGIESSPVNDFRRLMPQQKNIYNRPFAPNIDPALQNTQHHQQQIAAEETSDNISDQHQLNNNESQSDSISRYHENGQNDQDFESSNMYPAVSNERPEIFDQHS